MLFLYIVESFVLYQQYLSTFSKHGDFVDKKTLVSNKVSELKRKEQFFREMYNLFQEIIFVKLFWVLLPTFVRSFDIKNLSKKTAS